MQFKSTSIPCRAKDPHTCKYHGAELKAEEALMAGNIDDFLHWQAQMSAVAKTTPEVVEFFSAQQQRRESKSVGYYPREAERSLAGRISAYYRGNPNDRFPLGGYANQIDGQVETIGRQIYTATAQRLLGLATRETYDGVNEYSVDRERLVRALNLAQDDNLENARDNELVEAGVWDEVYDAHNYVRKVLLEQFARTDLESPATRASLHRLVREMDRAYWQKPNPSKDGGAGITQGNIPVNDSFPTGSFRKSDETRAGRLADHNHGKPYLVGGTAEDVENTEFTAARLVYQRTANELIKNVSLSLSGKYNATTTNWYTFERGYNSFADKMMDDLDTDDITPATDREETRRTLDQVFKVLQARVQVDGPHEAINLNRALRSLDLAFWNSPHGPGER